MRYEFEVYQMKVEDHLFWVAKSKSLKGCVGQGNTSNEAIAELEQNEIDWLETAKLCGIPIPKATIKTDGSQFSGKVSLRFSPFVHERASEFAKQQGISLNQYINDAIVYYNSMLHERTGSISTSKEKSIEKTSSSIIQFDSRRKSSSSDVTLTKISNWNKTDDELEEL